MKRTQTHGLTFVELMLTVTIFAIVAVVIYSTFGAGISAWRKAQQAQGAYQDIQLVLDKLAGDLEKAVLYSGKDDFFNFVGEKSKISFYSLVEIIYALPWHQQLKKITYSLDEDRHILQRLEQTFAEAIQGSHPQEPEEMAVQVSNFSLSYCYQKEDAYPPYDWKDSWDSPNNIPQAVKIELELEPEKLIFIKYVLIPTGVKGVQEQK